MRMDALIVTCALVALVACPQSNAQQFPTTSGHGPAAPQPFVASSGNFGQPVKPLPGYDVMPVALVEFADAVPLAPSQADLAPPARLPASQPVGSGAIAATMPTATPARQAVAEFTAPTDSLWQTASHGGTAYQTDGKCPADCKGKCCCPPAWAHRSGVFGEFLFLRPRDSEVAFALPVDGDIPIGPVGVADQDYATGFRAGLSHCLDECTSLVATFTQFESSTYNFVETDPTPALRALLLHPATTNAGSDFLSAAANYDIDFQLVDVDYRALLFAGDCFAVNYSVGARFANLEQDLQVDYALTGTTETVVTDLDFNGAGIRLGLDGERHSGHHGLLCYGKAFVSFVGGEFQADYDHYSTADPSIVDTAWRAGRVVTMLDLEMGVGWQSPCGHYRLTTGYVFSTWLNTVNTDSWIESVRTNNFVGLEDRMSFDGLTARAEYRF